MIALSLRSGRVESDIAELDGLSPAVVAQVRKAAVDEYKKVVARSAGMTRLEMAACWQASIMVPKAEIRGGWDSDWAIERQSEIAAGLKDSKLAAKLVAAAHSQYLARQRSKT